MSRSGRRRTGPASDAHPDGWRRPCGASPPRRPVPSHISRPMTSIRSAPPITPIAPPPVADLDWSPDRAEALGHDAVALWRELLERLRDLPISTARGQEEVRDAVAHAVPDEPLGHDELLASLRTLVLENATYTGHPGFVAFISGSGTIPGAAADLLAAAHQPERRRMAAGAGRDGDRAAARAAGSRSGCGSPPRRAASSPPAARCRRSPASRWRATRWPDGTCGAPALQGERAAHDVRVGAVARGEHARRRHARAGQRRDAIHRRGRGAAHARGPAARGDRARRARRPPAGRRWWPRRGRWAPAPSIRSTRSPTCARSTALWLHVDGAYGGVAALTDELAPRFAGIERADSIALDPHKWLYTPHSGGVVLVRDERRMAESFGVRARATCRGQGAHRPRGGLLRADAELLARLPRAEDLDLAARARLGGVQPPHRARRGARALAAPARARRGGAGAGGAAARRSPSPASATCRPSCAGAPTRRTYLNTLNERAHGRAPDRAGGCSRRTS